MMAGADDLSAVLTRHAIRVDEIADEAADAYKETFRAWLESGVAESDLPGDAWDAISEQLGAEPPLEPLEDLASVPVAQRDVVWRQQLAGLVSVATAFAFEASGALDDTAAFADEAETETQRIASRLGADELGEARVNRRDAKAARKARRG